MAPDAGQTVQANCPNGLLFGTVCQPGMAVIVISANVGAMGVLFLFFPMVLRGMGPVAAAVMDIAMDVTAACAELERHKPDISRKALFTAGMNVGRDVMGTMSTTLILAFFGGSLGVWLLDYAYDLPYLQLINSNAVGIEIMKGFSASFGVIFTVPIAAALSAVTHKVEHK